MFRVSGGGRGPRSADPSAFCTTASAHLVLAGLGAVRLAPQPPLLLHQRLEPLLDALLLRHERRDAAASRTRVGGGAANNTAAGVVPAQRRDEREAVERDR